MVRYVGQRPGLKPPRSTKTLQATILTKLSPTAALFLPNTSKEDQSQTKATSPTKPPTMRLFHPFPVFTKSKRLKKNTKSNTTPPHPPKNKALQCVVAVIVGRGCISKQGKWSAASLVSNTEKSRSDPVCLKEEMSKYWDIIGTLWWGVLFVWQTDGLYLGQNENKESSDTCVWYISGPYFTFLTQNIIPIFRTLCKGL